MTNMSDYEKARYAYFERQWNTYRAIVEYWLCTKTTEYKAEFISEMIDEAQQKVDFYSDVLTMLERKMNG